MVYKVLKKTLLQEFVMITRALILILSLGLLFGSFTVPMTAIGRFYIVCQFIVAAAFISPFERFRATPVLGLFAALSFFAVCFIEAGTPRNPVGAEYCNLPHCTKPSGLSAIVMEEDAVLLAARIFPFIGAITSAESKDLISVLRNHYRTMRSEHGIFGTPLLRTYFMLRSSSRFGLLLFPPQESERNERSDTHALLFLHGTGGNWSLACWLAAQPANELGLPVFCPSSGALGVWGSDDGMRTVQAAIQEIHRRGYRHIYLAGLSGGAVGAAWQIKRLPGVFEGALLLFGSHPDIIEQDLPTAHIFGTQDERFPRRVLHWIAKRQSKHSFNVKINPIEGNHFAILNQAEAVRTKIRENLEWLLQLSTTQG